MTASFNRISMILVVMLFTTVATVTAQDLPQIMSTISSAQMKALLNAEGFTDVTIDEDDDLIVRMNGYRVLIIVSGNEYSNIFIKFALAGTSASMKGINTWNKNARFTRAYLDDDGDPVLEMDIDLEGGITPDRIRDGIRTFSRAHASFLRDVAN